MAVDQDESRRAREAARADYVPAPPGQASPILGMTVVNELFSFEFTAGEGAATPRTPRRPELTLAAVVVVVAVDVVVLTVQSSGGGRRGRKRTLRFD